MQYYWLYEMDMRYSTSVAREYMLSQQIAREEIELMQAQAQAMQLQGPVLQTAIDERMVMEYIQLIQNPDTPDSVIEQFFAQKGLADDQILLLQQQAVTQMESMNTAGMPASSQPATQSKFCKNCGKQLPTAANFCDVCGSRQ
jgi:hypothetical protein